MENKLSTIVSFFKDSPPEVDKDFCSSHILKTIPKGQFIAMEGEDCDFLPIVKTGLVRVYKLSPNGQEMTLYRIKAGESCILTISCLLTNKKFPAVAFTESESEVILIDAKTVKRWINRHNSWRDFIFNYMSNIIFKVIALLENTTFNRTESRIIDFLLSNSDEKGFKLNLTHQHIASEIGTSREVVSRILKDLEIKQIIKLSRGSISILQKDALKKKSLIIN
jgi:CRP/FNR family transcriptional regulator, anaerobic regulatory protein